MHTSRLKPSENATRQLMALLIAGLALGGPLVGMMLVSLGGHSYMHLLPEYAPLPLSLAILSVGGTAVGLALLPSFFFGAVCGYVLPNFWPYLAASTGLAWATALGLGLGRLFSTSFLEVLLQRKADWWSVYQRLVHASGAFLPTSIALLRLAPHMPFALTNLACARLPLSPKTIWSASFVGLLPRTLFAVHIGSQLQDWRSFTQSPRTAVGTPALSVPPHRVGLCKPQSRAADRCIETSPFLCESTPKYFSVNLPCFGS